MKVFLFFLLFWQVNFAQSQIGTLQGVVVDENHEPLPFVKVIVYSSDEKQSFISGVESDFDGRFNIRNLAPGVYDVQLSDYAFGLDTIRIENVKIQLDQITMLDTVEMTQIEFTDCICLPYYPSEVKRSMDPFGRSIKIESEDIKRH